MNIKALLPMCLAALASVCFAGDRNIPSGYYNSINGKTTSELKTAVSKVISPHNKLSYSGLPSNFQRTDVYPESRRWWDMYSDIPLYAPSFSGLNREHSFPKSWWGGSTDVMAYVDLNHLYPSESAANLAKNNYPLGTVDRTTTLKFNNGISRVGVPVTGQGGGASMVFEPDDEYKGDFARTYFYMVTCYQDYSWKYTYMVQDGVYPTLNTWSQELLLKWAREDKVSQKEIDRNEAVYSIQRNRNPFIDFPELFEYIWGNKMGDPFILSEHLSGNVTTGEPTLVAPQQGEQLEFGQVAIGTTGRTSLHLFGENLTAGKSITLAIYDTADTDNATAFAFTDGTRRTKVSTALVNADGGTWLDILYTPTDTGTHETHLVIANAGIEGSIDITLRGEGIDVGKLTPPTALAASNVTATSYVANWEPAAGDVVDYYIVNRTIYGANGAQTEQLQAEETSLLIEDFSGSESYTVQSVRLGVTSAESNAISVGKSGIIGVEGPTAFSARNFGNGILINCADRVSNLRIYRPSGALVFSAAEACDNDVIELPEGIYFVSVDGLGRSIKVIVCNF